MSIGPVVPLAMYATLLNLAILKKGLDTAVVTTNGEMSSTTREKNRMTSLMNMGVSKRNLEKK